MRVPVRSTILVLVFVVTGCAVGRPEPADDLDQPNPAVTRMDVSTDVETGEYFVELARDHFEENDLEVAEEVINRGFNVAPENPLLWHILAKIRFLQEQYGESETLASRSLSYAAEDSELVTQNWRLIAHARKASGNEAGARRALERVETKPGGEGWFDWFPF